MLLVLSMINLVYLLGNKPYSERSTNNEEILNELVVYVCMLYEQLRIRQHCNPNGLQKTSWVIHGWSLSTQHGHWIIGYHQRVLHGHEGGSSYNY